MPMPALIKTKSPAYWQGKRPTRKQLKTLVPDMSMDEEHEKIKRWLGYAPLRYKKLQQSRNP